MKALVINISFDLSEKSLTSVVSRVILFGTVPTEIPIVPDMPTDLPIAPELPAVSPFLCLDDSKSKLTGHLRDTYHLDFMNTWFLEIAIASPACISTPVIIASPAVHESSDEGSPVTQRELDMDLDIQVEVEAMTVTAATTIVDGLETDEEAEAESQPEGTIEFGVDVVTRSDISDDLIMPNVVERLGQLEEGMQDLLMRTKARIEMITITEVEEIETMTIRIDEAYEMPWKDLMKLMIEVYFLRNEIQLTLLCPMMVPEENDKIERMANGLMDQNQPPFKRQNVAQAVTMDNNKKRGYAGSASYGNKYRWHHEGPCTVKCTSCKKGHYRSDCPKLKKQNCRNKAISNDAHGRPYALGGDEEDYNDVRYVSLEADDNKLVRYVHLINS
nr:hypothetical protein [Tanacetum cinerariifolium]